MDVPIGYAKHSLDGYNSGNSRNGYNRKTLKGDHGAIEIKTQRDRNGSFEPVFVAKNQTRLTEFDDQILLLYAHLALMCSAIDQPTTCSEYKSITTAKYSQPSNV
jgi:transposase-like protein